MIRYIEQETEYRRRRCYAAKYRPGDPVSMMELRKVARQLGHDAQVAEVLPFKIALIHYVVAPMGFPDEKYLPVHENHMLIAHEEADYLYTMTESQFNRKYEIDPGEGPE